MIQKVLISMLVFGGLLGLSGCSTYTQQSRHITDAWQSGDGLLAAAEVTAKADKESGSRDELIWRLEQGSILAAVGDYEGSLAAFDTAEELVNLYEDEAGIKVGNEALSLISTQANLVYRGRAYDKIMLNTCKALNYLCLSSPDLARVELNRALQRQKNAVAENEKKIAAALDAAEQAKAGELETEDGSQTAYDVDRARQDERFAAATAAELAEVERRLLPYADYVNPFSVFMDGLFFCHFAYDNSDIERARKDFERVKGMSPGVFITEDYRMVEAMAAGAPADCLTYVIFATGSAPSRDEVRIDIPMFFVSDHLSYVGASFPQLVYHDDYIPHLTATVDGRTFRSELICSMDAVVSRDFKNEWPTVLTKTLLTTAAKASAGYAVEKQVADDNVLGKLAIRALSVSYQAATNIADTRSWTTLPKEVSYLRVPTPDSGEICLRIGTITRTVRVDAGKTNILLVRSVNRFAPPILEQITIN